MKTSTTAAALVRADEGPTVHWGPGGQIRILAGADSTDGAFSVVEALEEPRSAAPLHVHQSEAEAFYVLEGEIELICGEQTLRASAGDFVYTPQNVPHKYTVVSDRPARILLMFSRPGFERFFLEGGTPFGQPPAAPPDPTELQRLVAKYDLELLERFEH